MLSAMITSTTGIHGTFMLIKPTSFSSHTTPTTSSNTENVGNLIPFFIHITSFYLFFSFQVFKFFDCYLCASSMLLRICFPSVVVIKYRLAAYTLLNICLLGSSVPLSTFCIEYIAYCGLNDAADLLITAA